MDIFNPISDENIIKGTDISSGKSAKPIYFLKKLKLFYR